MEKNEWIEEVLNSANETKKLEPRQSLLLDIEHKIYAGNTVNTKTVWFAAASIILLVSVNLRALSKADDKKIQQDAITTDNPFSSSNQLY